MKRLLIIALILLACIVPAYAVDDITEYYGWTHGNTTWIDQTAVGGYYTHSFCCLLNSYCEPPGGSASIATSFSGTAMCTDHKLANLTNYAWNGSAYSWYTKFYANPYMVSANFTGTPTYGTGPLSVAFTDTTLNASILSTYNWTVSPVAGWYVTSGTINSKDAGITFVTNGNYTISHGVTAPAGSDIETKTDYIWVYNSTSLITTYATARDLYTGFAITGAQVDMQDIENSSWTNTTTTNGIGSISTLVGHHLNIWASASGYDDDNLAAVDAIGDGYYSLLLKPTNITTFNATPGNLTLFVTVEDLLLPHPTIQGAEVTAAWGSQYASGTTNAAGSVAFTVPNNTAIYLSAFKSGYASGSKSYITGSANGGSTTETTVMYIGTDYVTPTITTTWTGTGTIPPTVDPYPCVGDGSAQDNANCQRKQGGMAASLITMGPDLVNFFIMLTIVGGLLLISKGIK